MTWFKNYKLNKLTNKLADLNAEKEDLLQIISTVENVGVVEAAKILTESATVDTRKYKLFRKARNQLDNWERYCGWSEDYFNHSPKERKDKMIKILSEEVLTTERRIEWTEILIRELNFEIYRGKPLW